MKFLFKRYVHGVLKRRSWFFLVLILPCLYLFISTIQADRFTVTQNIAIADSEPIALTSSPVGYMLLKDIASDPTNFFQNSFAINSLSRELFGGSSANLSESQSKELIGAIKNNLSMAITGKGMLKIQYYGTDMKTGEALVTYYSKRLLQGAKEGITRSNTAMTSDYLSPIFSGGLYIIEHRALWRLSRFVPMVKMFIYSCIGVLLLFWVMEWSDSSFKSERQIGRYLKLPVLGSVPDLDRVSNMIAPKI